MSDSHRKLAETRVGTELRKWTIDHLIDVGGMAAVYAATHRNGNRVAVKVLHTQFSRDGEARDRFLREGYVANKVGHPGAVQVLDDDETEDGSAFLVMELLLGESLERRLERKGRLDAVEALWIADHTLAVLAAGHANGVIHRDIKPGNLFLTREGQVKVLDFGFARVRERAQSTGTTRDGIVIGTVSYMAPEQAQAKNDLIDGRVDVFSVGATLFTSLTGEVIHKGNTPIDRLMSAMKNPAPRLATVAPHLPQPLIALVDTALEYQRDRRFPSASAMQEAVRQAFVALTGGPTPSASRPSWASGEPSVAVEVDLDDEPSVALELARPKSRGPAFDPRLMARPAAPPAAARQPAAAEPDEVTASMIEELPAAGGDITDSMISELPETGGDITDSMILDSPILPRK